MSSRWLGIVVLAGCAGEPSGDASSDGSEDTGSSSASSSPSSTAPSTSDGSSGSDDGSSSDSSGSDSSSTGEDTTGGPPGECEAADVHAPWVACDENGRGGSFTPVVEWERAIEVGTRWSTSPMVINLTDDNGDDEVDLCDTPDVVVAYCDATDEHYNPIGVLLVLDGATGEEHFDIRVRCDVNPALGDVDGDGEPEIFTYLEDSRPTLLSGTGEIERQSHPSKDFGGVLAHYSSMSDLDNDGDVEIVHGHLTFDHTLDVVEVLPNYTGRYHSLVDLDGDDDMEIIYRAAAHHHDGTLIWSFNEPVEWSYESPLVAAIAANLDEDDDPELVFGTQHGLWIREHDGTEKTLVAFDAVIGSFFGRPIAVAADFDGDAQSELALSDTMGLIVHELDGALSWSWAEDPMDHVARLAAFDFLGQGRAQLVHANEVRWGVLDNGVPVAGGPWPETGGFAVARGPTIADADNDGSAEILIAEWEDGGLLRSYGAEDGSWVRARRIWNQFDYRVTNVSEDGSIPIVEPKWWLTHNTAGTQAQITATGEACAP